MCMLIILIAHQSLDLSVVCPIYKYISTYTAHDTRDRFCGLRQSSTFGMLLAISPTRDMHVHERVSLHHTGEIRYSKHTSNGLTWRKSERSACIKYSLLRSNKMGE